MPPIRWSQDYRTGNVAVDGQHRHLFRLSANLDKAIERGAARAEVKSTLLSLVLYTMSHFDAEEELMRINHYPGLAAHRKLHDHLTDQVQRLAADYTADKGISTVNVSEFLNNWLVHHIHNIDKDMINFVVAARRCG